MLQRAARAEEFNGEIPAGTTASVILYKKLWNGHSSFHGDQKEFRDNYDRRGRKNFAWNAWSRKDRTVAEGGSPQGRQTGVGQSAGPAEVRCMTHACYRLVIHQIYGFIP